jgi:fibronectin type 3 domain-containing protein
VAGTAPVAIEGPASAEVCETPADTFPPAAPSNLAALATEGVINLTWDAVTAADLAGYVVLRAEATGDRLQPLMTSPITATVWADRTARAGVRYVYAVVAVDAAGNRSAESTRVEETGR